MRERVKEQEEKRRGPVTPSTCPLPAQTQDEAEEIASGWQTNDFEHPHVCWCMHIIVT